MSAPAVKRFLATLAILALSACGGSGMLRPNTTVAASADESIVIMGVRPADFNVLVFRGEIRSGLFDMNTRTPATLHGEPFAGYLVARAKAGEPIAITAIVFNDGTIVKPRFTPCGDTQTHTWDIPAGKVLFLGNFDFVRQGETLSVSTHFDVDGAKAHLSQHFPGLASGMEVAASTMRATTRLCSSTSVGSTIYWTSAPRRR